jgi:hypothetical protein
MRALVVRAEYERGRDRDRGGRRGGGAVDGLGVLEHLASALYDAAQCTDPGQPIAQVAAQPGLGMREDAVVGRAREPGSARRPTLGPRSDRSALGRVESAQTLCWCTVAVTSSRPSAREPGSAPGCLGSGSASPSASGARARRRPWSMALLRAIAEARAQTSSSGSGSSGAGAPSNASTTSVRTSPASCTSTPARRNCAATARRTRSPAIGSRASPASMHAAARRLSRHAGSGTSPIGPPSLDT